MNLLSNIEKAIDESIKEEIDARTLTLQLDLQRIGGDVATLAEKMGQLMDALQNHKEVIQSLVHSNHQVAASLSSRSSKPKFGPLHKNVPVGPN